MGQAELQEFCKFSARFLQRYCSTFAVFLQDFRRIIAGFPQAGREPFPGVAGREANQKSKESKRKEREEPCPAR